MVRVMLQEHCVIIIAVKESLRDSIIAELNHIGVDQYITISNHFVHELFYEKRRDTRELLFRIEELENALVRTMRKPAINVSFHLTDSCNLNCKGCWHFAPLAKGEMVSVDEFEKDVKRLAELMQGEITLISLFGGEPLMHPKAYMFPYIVKKNLPDTYVELLTNGILLPKQTEDFWKSVKDNDVVIEWTRYPIGDKTNKEIEKVLKAKNVSYRFFDGEDEKVLSKIFLDVNAIGDNGQRGRNDARKQWIRCYSAGDCVQLKKHRLYPCSTAANAHIFVDYFKQKMRLSDCDGINIYEAKSKDEVLEFLSQPIPFCRYCNVGKDTITYEWEASRREITEWT